VTNRTQLVAGEIVHGTGLAAWLIKPDNGPEAVMIIWPDEPTSVSPSHYGDLVGPSGRCRSWPDAVSVTGNASSFHRSFVSWSRRPATAKRHLLECL
jgi:hypothetical protein